MISTVVSPGEVAEASTGSMDDWVLFLRHAGGAINAGHPVERQSIKGKAVLVFHWVCDRGEVQVTAFVLMHRNEVATHYSRVTLAGPPRQKKPDEITVDWWLHA